MEGQKRGILLLLPYFVHFLLTAAFAGILILAYSELALNLWAGLTGLTAVSAVFTLVCIIKMIRYKKAAKAKRNALITSLYTVVPQMEIIYTFFVSLGRFQDSKEFKSLNLEYTKIKNNISLLRNYINELNGYRNKLKESRPYSLDLTINIDDRLREINNHLYNILLDTTASVDMYKESFLKQKRLKNKFSHNMMTLIYYMEKAVPIVTDFSDISNRFSSEILMQILEEFESISSFSQKITVNIQDTMRSFMDETKEDSLARMIQKGKDLTSHFNQFYNDMDQLQGSSQNFVRETVKKLKEISKVTSSIQDIAKTIRMLSLNVSIEAANTKNGDSNGFHVLARDLREFANKTMGFSQDVRTSVSKTIEATGKLQKEYTLDLKTVYGYMEEIKGSIESFDSILKNSFDKIQDIISSLDQFSKNMNQDIKNIVGKLQYYDITKQEIEHLSQFIRRIFEVFEDFKQEVDVEAELTHPEKEEIKRNLLKYINDMITTRNEREILEKYEEVFDITVSGEHKLETREHPEFSEEENIIVF